MTEKKGPLDRLSDLRGEVEGEVKDVVDFAGALKRAFFADQVRRYGHSSARRLLLVREGARAPTRHPDAREGRAGAGARRRPSKGSSASRGKQMKRRRRRYDPRVAKIIAEEIAAGAKKKRPWKQRIRIALERARAQGLRVPRSKRRSKRR